MDLQMMLLLLTVPCLQSSQKLQSMISKEQLLTMVMVQTGLTMCISREMLGSQVVLNKHGQMKMELACQMLLSLRQKLDNNDLNSPLHILKDV